MESTTSIHVYEVRPRKDKHGFDLISDVLPFGRLWYGEPNAVGNTANYAKFFSRLHDAVVRVYEHHRNTPLPVALRTVCFWLGTGRQAA